VSFYDGAARRLAISPWPEPLFGCPSVRRRFPVHNEQHPQGVMREDCLLFAQQHLDIADREIAGMPVDDIDHLILPAMKCSIGE
jgi:hypothetical protein